MPYTENLCVNPSFQDGSLGYSQILNAKIALDTSRKLFGSAQSLRVVTPGVLAGEGVITAGGLIPTSAVCSASLYIQGTGMVSVSADVNPGGIVKGTVPVSLTSSWQRVVVENIVCTPGQTLYLTAYTTSTQAATFWISAIQIETDPTVHTYCDGDQPGCSWLSGPPGISVQQFQFGTQAVGFTYASGNMPAAIVQGEAFFGNIVPSVSIAFGDSVFPGLVNPVAALDDFAIFEAADTDPAQTYVNINNAGVDSGTSGAYNRVFSTFYAPLDYVVSGGNILWNRAAYAALGFQFASVPAGGSQNISNVQVEILPMTASTPSDYSLPRIINTIVIPDRLNFCTNPGIETSTSGWSALGSATLTRDATVFFPDVTIYDDVQTSSLHSLKITLNAPGDGAQISIADLIVGNQYTISAYVLAGAGLENITILSGSSSSSAATVNTGAGYGVPGYGTGPYGSVILSGTDLATDVWFRPFFTFIATSSVQNLQVLFTPGSDISYPAHMWVDNIMVELGDLLQPYFDGNFGPVYFWEGTANLSRSYFYDQYFTKQNAVNNVLARHTPLGISYSTPLFKVPYTQI